MRSSGDKPRPLITTCVRDAMMLRFCFESSVRKSDLLTESVNGASVKQDDMRAITYDAAAHGTISDLLLNLSLAREPVVVKGAYGSFVRAVPLNLTCEQMTWWKGQAFVQHNSRIFFHERHGSGQRWEEPRREKVSDAQCKRLRARESFLLLQRRSQFRPADVVSALTFGRSRMSPCPSTSDGTRRHRISWALRSSP